MRTTVTLDPDARALLERVMRERRVSFKSALNDAIRSGLDRGRPGRRFRSATFPMGAPRVSLTGAHALAASLEDEEMVRELTTGR